MLTWLLFRKTITGTCFVSDLHIRKEMCVLFHWSRPMILWSNFNQTKLWKNTVDTASGPILVKNWLPLLLHMICFLFIVYFLPVCFNSFLPTCLLCKKSSCFVHDFFLLSVSISIPFIHYIHPSIPFSSVPWSYVIFFLWTRQHVSVSCPRYWSSNPTP